MADRSDLREEEAKFLTGHAGGAGTSRDGVLERIRDALGLDYGGVDFAVARDGESLLFEANATMTILRRARILTGTIAAGRSHLSSTRRDSCDDRGRALRAQRKMRSENRVQKSQQFQEAFRQN